MEEEKKREASEAGGAKTTRRKIVMRLPQYEDDYALREAMKALRTNIEFMGEDKKVLAITSCVRDEGKSFISMNLAMSLADGGKNVLFIDADLRKSVVIGRYNIKGQSEGLSNYLAARVNIESVLVSTNMNRLDMIVAGQIPPNPSELLGTRRFAKMMNILRGHYDYVIVDCPPIGEVIDAAIVARACDGAILVTASGHDSSRFLRDAREQMEKSGSKVLGVVLNKVPRDRHGSRYGKYYGKYGRYYGRYYGKYYGQYGSYDNSDGEDGKKAKKSRKK